MKKILLLDSLNILYRSYYGLPPLKNSSQVNVGALFGLSKTLKVLNDTFSDSCFIGVTDTRKSIRKDMYSFYKANRQEAPQELEEQKKLFPFLFTALGIPLLQKEGYEADDIISHIIKEYHNVYEFIIVTADKDLRYLALYPHVSIYDPLKNCIYDKTYLQKTYSNDVTIEQIWIFYALMGDASDNVPGVKGVGEKSAHIISNLYQSYNDFLTSYFYDIRIKDKLKNLIKTQEEQFKISYELIKNIDMVYDNAIEKALKECNKIDFNYAYDLFQEWEFKSLLKNLYRKNNQASHGFVTEENNNGDKKPYAHLPYAHESFTYRLYTKECHTEILESLSNGLPVAFDTETYGGDHQTSFAIGYSLCYKKGEAWYIALYKEGERVSDYDDRIRLLKCIIEKASLIIMHNSNFDLHILNNTIPIMPHSVFDTMIAAYNIYGDSFKVGLKDLSGRLLHQQMISFFDLLTKYDVKTFDSIPIDEAAKYAAADAHQTLMLYQLFIDMIEKNECYKYLMTIEMPLVKTLYTIEKNGFTCDKNILDNQRNILMHDLNIIMQSIKEMLKEIPDASYINEFNPVSHQQVNKLLFTIMGLQGSFKTQQKKHFSTNQKSLETLKYAHPIISLIIDYRTLSSIMARCAVGLKKYIKEDGKIHCSFQQVHVSTGRLSSVNPNLQNIPVRDHRYNYSIRSAFIPSKKDNTLVSFDYSQIELRILAHVSGDTVLCDAFKYNKDVHVITASHIYKKPINEITEDERSVGKKINFSIMYGARAYNISKELGITSSDAQKYLDLYWQTYNGVKQWIEKTIIQSTEKGYSETINKRKRFIPELSNKNLNMKKHGERMAINSVIQGSAAELMKKGMIAIDALLKEYSHAAMIMQVHDEIILDIPTCYAKEIIEKGKVLLESLEQFSIPLIVNSSSGDNWERL